ncbi:hypothetical protein Tco_0942445, partial [Tanacetum coccineum]
VFLRNGDVMILASRPSQAAILEQTFVIRVIPTKLDGALGFPSLPRAVSGGSERRCRLASESVLYGMAYMHDRHKDMRLDIDNMSYKELLALEERIGYVNNGLTEENISKLALRSLYETPIFDEFHKLQEIHVIVKAGYGIKFAYVILSYNIVLKLDDLVER